MPRRRFADIALAAVEPNKYKYATTHQVTALSPALIDEFCELLARGNPATTACDFIGITDSRFQTWRRKGELVRQGDEGIVDGNLYLMFVLGMRRACAQWVMARVTQAQSPVNKYWFRDLRLLMIRDRANFSVDAQGGSDEMRDANESFL